MKLGYFLSSEEFAPHELVEQAKLAEQAGFEALWISDHFHPWNDEQGESGFVWSVIGAISQVCRLPITTAVTCPIMRIHPAIIAQAAATSSLLTGGRFRLGVGTGEALNEHILGDRWPPGSVRLAMLEEAIAVMRKLFTGKVISHHGVHYVVEQARLYSCPDEPPPIYMSAFGPKAIQLAGRVADGYCGVTPDAEMVRGFRVAGGAGKPAQAGVKVCVGDIAEARRRVHRTWPNDQLPGELAQVLPTPQHFMQASQLVTEDMVADAVVCGEDVGAHLRNLQQYADAGYDELYVNQIGPEQERFFAFYATKVMPELG
jgi:G6PDH family F420-dependent oxidoreductase